MVVTEPVLNIADTTVSKDSVAADVGREYGLVLSVPENRESAPLREGGALGTSFILSGLFLLALVIALRFHDNMKHIVAIVHDLMSTRVRQNAFDDTVRETSLLVLLNVLWCACAGITCYWVYVNSAGGIGAGNAATGMLGGMAMAGAYSLFLYISYWTVGWVFSDVGHSELWVKGYAASQALMAPAFFIIALLAMCCPHQAGIVGVFALIIFILGKLAFILKGYMIFFNQISSWVLFLCYLCSLEIVPLILCYRCAVLLG